MKTNETYEVKMPNYAMCYLINDDASGITDEDKRNIDEYMDVYYQEAEKVKGHVVISETNIDQEPYFTCYPPFGLACSVVDVNIVILV
jgi:hypothetical protein